jgi:hypothetical protein
MVLCLWRGLTNTDAKKQRKAIFQEKNEMKCEKKQRQKKGTGV